VQDRNTEFAQGDTGVGVRRLIGFTPLDLHIDTSRGWALFCDAERVGVFGRERSTRSLSKDNEICLTWLADALQRLRQEDQTNGRTKVVSYLEAVSEEVVFEMKALPRS
jgi:hypothetical protein